MKGWGGPQVKIPTSGKIGQKWGTLCAVTVMGVVLYGDGLQGRVTDLSSSAVVAFDLLGVAGRTNASAATQTGLGRAAASSP